jgi:catechol 2,3-dioxygenase-like lactoylglutathione lyase family enzyme
MESHNRIIAGCGFHHVAVRVHDFDAAVRFYKALGMSEAHAWGEDNRRVVLMDTGDGNYIEILAGGAAGEKPQWGEGAALVHVALRTTDVNAATEIAKAAGAIVTLPPKDATLGRPGGKQANVRISFVHAPGGEVIEFFQSREL